MGEPRLPGQAKRKRTSGNSGRCEAWTDRNRTPCGTDVEFPGLQRYTFCPKCFSRVLLGKTTGETPKSGEVRILVKRGRTRENKPK